MKSAVGLCMWALLCLFVAPQSQAQNSESSLSTFRYDISSEVTLTGTVAGTLSKAPAGMFTGSHLMLTTSSGLVAASVGSYRFKGERALPISAGQQVTVTGVMRTIGNRQVFWTRTVKIGSEVYVIRNQHGFALPPYTHRSAMTSVEEGR